MWPQHGQPSGIAELSYGIAALAFLAFAVLLASGWRARHHARALSCACGLSALWACLAAWSAGYGRLGAWPYQCAEALRCGAWLMLLILLSNSATDGDGYRYWYGFRNGGKWLCLAVLLLSQWGADVFFSGATVALVMN